MYYPQRDQMGGFGLYSADKHILFPRMLNWREDCLSLSSPVSTGFPVASLLERNRRQVDGMREKNF